ncbi:MAG TPA: two-component regulator propeller domain-containing protein, partial [Chitinophagaceae bacterium]
MRIFALILFAAIAFHTRAQEFTYRQFTTADGLPSNVVYGAFQDNNGYIWFCTSAGVSRFNGISFQNFTVEHGLSDNEVFGAFQTPSGRIWFRTFSNKLCYYENGSFHNFRTDPWLDKIFGGMKIAYVDPEGLVWTRNYIDTFVYVMNEKTKVINRIPAFFKDSSIIVTPRGLDTIARADEKFMFQLLVDFEKKSKKIVDAIPDITSYFMYVRNCVNITCQKYPAIPRHFVYYVYLNSSSIQRYKLNELIYPANAADRATTSNSYWVTTANKGILNVNNADDVRQEPDVYLPDRNVNNLLVDKEGNYWFTSPTEGVFLLTAHSVKTYQPDQREAEIYSVTGNDQ